MCVSRVVVRLGRVRVRVGRRGRLELSVRRPLCLCFLHRESLAEDENAVDLFVHGVRRQHVLLQRGLGKEIQTLFLAVVPGVVSVSTLLTRARIRIVARANIGGNRVSSGVSGVLILRVNLGVLLLATRAAALPARDKEGAHIAIAVVGTGVATPGLARALGVREAAAAETGGERHAAGSEGIRTILERPAPRGALAAARRRHTGAHFRCVALVTATALVVVLAAAHDEDDEENDEQKHGE